ncbi:hypothetical protein FSP39_004824 [Pinctada imbricata]|uniref:Proteasome subunit beta type-4 n=1 Tax=Pinctada imbricata TaxID=66713 RepID=A0AA89BY16_PINIB|nr:hypothetical protein FSP39_004824 [Pinctada imbricata]
MTKAKIMETEFASAFWRNGPQPGAIYQFPGKQTTQNTSQIGAAKRTLQPTVTGTSVLGLKFDGGIIIAADMLGSYGSLARYRNLSRLMKVNDNTVIGMGGDYADFQFLQSIIEQRVIEEECLNDGFSYTPKSLSSWMTRVMYNRRSNFNPLWNTYLVGGLQDGEPYLSYIDKIGIAFEAPTVACGFGSYIALPLLRDVYEANPNMSLSEAEKHIDRCMKILYYRDARSLNKYETITVTKDGAMLKSPIVSDTNWEIAHLINCSTMLRLTIFVVLYISISAFDVNLNNEWEKFKVEFNRNYMPSEESIRRSIWEGHIRLIEKHNLEADLGLHTYRLGMNDFGDLSNEEFRQMMNGYVMRNTTSENVFTATGNALPETVDWRTQGYVTGIKNQGQCGSCWAFSTTGSLEGQHFKATGNLVSLSEQNLVDCSAAEGNKGCKGGLMDSGFAYIKKNNGIDTEASYPYTAKTGTTCRFTRSAVGATLKSWVDVKRDDEKALQEAVATVGPISVAIDAGHSSFQLYKSGIYNEPACSSTRLDHGVLAVGYGTQKHLFRHEDYWLVKNSWGEKWGMEGYIMMSRNKRNQCGVATQASYPVV